MTRKLVKLGGAVLGLGLAAAAGVSSAQATPSYTVGNITVLYYGEIGAAPNVVQPTATGTGGGFIGATEVGNPGTISQNAGWDPYGPSDTTHEWLNIYQGYESFAKSGTTLSFLWGSPNYDDPANANYVDFYSGNTLVGAITAADLYTGFAGLIDNNQHPGYLLQFVSNTAFDSVVTGVTGGGNDFEFAFTNGVPEPTTWAMMFAGFAGIGLLGWRRSRQPISIAL